MTNVHMDRRAAFRMAIERFLQERRDAKLERLFDDDPKRQALLAQFAQPAWIDDAARRVGQIQAVTHSLKAIHPDARGTSLYCRPEQLPPRAEVGTHALANDFADDVVGNAAALDVYKFLCLEVDGRTLLGWMLAGDADLKAALGDDSQHADAWIEAFTGLVQARSAGAASHTRAKQLYWLIGDDPSQDDHYHLLAPLYASSLAHAVFQTVNRDRFGEAAKAARQARWNGHDHETGYAEYPNLAVQKLGGTKPQNISQLNSARGGNNYLLGSLPPSWKSRAVREAWGVDSVFPQFGRRKPVRELVQALRDFLDSSPDPTKETRDRRDEFTDNLIDELVEFARERHIQLVSGWTADPKCDLVDEERLWLDPERAMYDDEFQQRWKRMEWPVVVGRRFGNWLNAELDGKLPVGEVEQRHWMRELLADEDWARMLDRQDRRIGRIEPPAAAGGAQ